MSLFLDSALASDARTAMSLGFVAGITTNPNLLAQIHCEARRDNHGTDQNLPRPGVLPEEFAKAVR